jgi:hypothetical protein
MTSGNGILLLGVLWLIFWIGPAYFEFEEDSRWGHNYALPILFIMVGLAYNINRISCQLVATIASYLTIPILLAFWDWSLSTIIALLFLAVFLVFYMIERHRKSELIRPNKRLRAWLKMHLMSFAYFGLVHMTFIFFLVRWNNPEPFLDYLPIEHHVSTSVFNAMLLVLVAFAIIERFVKKVGRFPIPKAGFIWSILMIIIPILSINIIGE